MGGMQAPLVRSPRRGLVQPRWRGAVIGCLLAVPTLAAGLAGGAAAQAPPTVAANMSFFVTSTGRGFGGNLGGLRGADALCAQRATAVGRGGRSWRAYLSTPAVDAAPAVNARDRIGTGPWFNANGVQVAADVDELHSDDNALSRATAITEKGSVVGENRHDIMTGSNPDGTLSLEAPDTTCRGWTSLNTGRAMLGHHNRFGGGQRPASWNSAHLSRGCSQDALRASLGDALIYCFAVD
jgi:hypothetical protein